LARDVLARLELNGDETVLDAGCGSGRVTAMLLERLPRGHVVAVDGAPSMVEKARDSLGDRATVIQSDLLELELNEPVDAVFSNAVFHWVPDHGRLYRRLADALKPGGRLVAQYGGKGNIAHFNEVAYGIARREPYASHAEPTDGTWRFTDADYAGHAAEAAGFTEIEAWLEPRPMRPREPLAYICAVCLAPFLERLPDELRDRYVDEVADALGDPLEIDYVRLNITARRGD
jgi:trans-aconitate 2-methyltransferase